MGDETRNARPVEVSCTDHLLGLIRVQSTALSLKISELPIASTTLKILDQLSGANAVDSLQKE